MPTRREFLIAGALAGAATLLPAEALGAGLSSAQLKQLDDAVKGQVLAPSSGGYAKAAQVYQQAVSAKPLAVVRAKDAADVAATVKWANRENVGLVARSGGHSYIGQSAGTNAVVVDLSLLRAVTVGASEVRVGGGAQLIDVNSTLASHGLVVPLGSCPSVGVGGSTLGGGMGLSARAYGLTCDRLMGAKVVLADGSTKTADDDLLWALRGGGGSFGIVTELRYKPAHLSKAAWIQMSFPWAHADAVLASWLEHASDWPDQLTTILSLSTGSGSPRLTLVGQDTRSEAAARSTLKPLTRIDGAHISTGTDTTLKLALRFAGCLETSVRACHTSGTREGGTLARSRFAASSAYLTKKLSGAGRKALLARIEQRQNAGGASGAVLLDSYGGAIASKSRSATAFAHRDAICSAQILSYYGSSSQASGANGWVTGTRSALVSAGGSGAYANYPDGTLSGYRSAYWGANYSRLKQLRKQLDPDTRFQFPQSV